MWSDEDYIGRVSRTARKCHAIQLSLGTKTAKTAASAGSPDSDQKKMEAK